MGFDFDSKRGLHEDEGAPTPAPASVPGGAYPQCGVYAPFQTKANTLGIGNPIPAGRPALTGSDYADSTQMGSGDRFATLALGKRKRKGGK